jgi:hypothetical protein
MMNSTSTGLAIPSPSAAVRDREAGVHHDDRDEAQREDDRLRQVAPRLVDLLGDGSGALEADERPADEGHRDEERPGQREVVASRAAAEPVGEDGERLVAVE